MAQTFASSTAFTAAAAAAAAAAGHSSSMPLPSLFLLFFSHLHPFFFPVREHRQGLIVPPLASPGDSNGCNYDGCWALVLQQAATAIAVGQACRLVGRAIPSPVSSQRPILRGKLTGRKKMEEDGNGWRVGVVREEEERGMATGWPKLPPPPPAQKSLAPVETGGR
jgi:hypothetical protein